MRWLGRWIGRLLIMLCVLGVALASPVIYVETMCRGQGIPSEYAATLPEENWRAETRTLLTYPEWHIVHAYDDYAQVISEGDPHDYHYWAAISGFWSSLCDLTQEAVTLGEIDGDTKQMVYVIGVSFSAELALKALYEETFGRAAIWVRGTEHTALDTLTAQQASEYAAFLQQVPWYRWPFKENAQALEARSTGVFRDAEREFAIGLEYRAKAAYAEVIAQAVESVGADAMTLRMVIKPKERDLSDYKDVSIVGGSKEGLIIETPRYRVLTHLLLEMARDDVQFVEIAGNDDIMFTTLSEVAEVTGAISSMRRQGYGDYRHIRLVKVQHLADALLGLQGDSQRLEHIHDY